MTGRIAQEATARPPSCCTTSQQLLHMHYKVLGSVHCDFKTTPPEGDLIMSHLSGLYDKLFVLPCTLHMLMKIVLCVSLSPCCSGAHRAALSLLEAAGNTPHRWKKRKVRRQQQQLQDSCRAVASSGSSADHTPASHWSQMCACREAYCYRACCRRCQDCIAASTGSQ